MKAVVALTFLALANAAIIDVPHQQQQQLHHVVLDTAAVIHPPATRAVLTRYGLEKPEFDSDFISFAHGVGAPDLPAVAALRDLYDEPVLLFFQDQLGDVVSHYAQGGMHGIVPEVRNAIGQLIGNADSFTVAYKPERILGDFKTILPNYFFQPIKDVSLIKFLNDPIPTPEDPTFMFNKHELMNMFPHLRSSVNVPTQFDIDELPLSYRLPVPLNVAPFAKSYFNVPADTYYKDLPQVPFYKDYTPAFYNDYYPMFYKDYTPSYYRDFTPTFDRDYTPAFYPYPREYFPREYPITKQVIPFDNYQRSYPEYGVFRKSYPEFGFYPKSYPEHPFYPRSYPIDYYHKSFYPLGKSILHPKTVINPQTEKVLLTKNIVLPQFENNLYPKTIIHQQVDNPLYPKTIVNAETPLKAAIKPTGQIVQPAYRFVKADYPYFTVSPTVDVPQNFKVLPQLYNEQCAYGQC